jgi:hypothetical protein
MHKDVKLVVQRGNITNTIFCFDFLKMRFASRFLSSVRLHKVLTLYFHIDYKNENQILYEINYIEFLAWIEIIKNQKYQKINTLVLHGTTNAGKSLFIRAATEFFRPTEITRERDNNSFHMDQLPTATAALSPSYEKLEFPLCQTYAEGRTRKM